MKQFMGKCSGALNTFFILFYFFKAYVCNNRSKNDLKKNQSLGTLGLLLVSANV